MPRFDLKKGKIILIVLIPVLIILLVILSLIDAVYEPPEEVIVYPEGNLSNDIFTEQNNSYTPNENLTQVHSFKEVPYLVDVATGNGAEVGSGTVYRLNEFMFAYVAEYSDPNTIQDIITSQFPAALVSDYVPEYTSVVTQVDRQGYINGFSAEYLAEDISVSNGSGKTDAVLLGYMLDLPGNSLYAGKHLWIGVGTASITNENIMASEAVLNLMMNTVRMDEKLAEEMEKEAAAEEERLEKEREEKERKELAKLEEKASREQPTEATEESEAVESEPVDSDIYTVKIPLEENYEMVQVKVHWSEPNPEAVLELFDPGPTLYYDPVERDETSAVFVIEGNEVGDYELRIKGAASCGVIDTPEVNAVSGTQDTGDALQSAEAQQDNVPPDTGGDSFEPMTEGD